MNRVLVCLAVAWMVAFTGSVSFAASPEPALNDALNTFLSGYKNKDADALSRVMSKEASQYSFREKNKKADLMSKQELLAWIRSTTKEKYLKYEADDRSVEYIGKSRNIAVVTADLTAAWKGAESKAYACFVFAMIDGKWQLVSYSFDQWQDNY
jgi:hypothetical protein